MVAVYRRAETPVVRSPTGSITRTMTPRTTVVTLAVRIMAARMEEATAGRMAARMAEATEDQTEAAAGQTVAGVAINRAPPCLQSKDKH